ncbi:FACT complex subunit-domain-containing protein [Polychytrium aggregatum]|uniref:FACT complex subunit-domain-containing protein n=1 Tax=Polychytrium aggregatum TaxID=110093 RepID=UPI0022FDE34E|nr:FACT complex subunit-domain-containing protein [Polychytrium aggregatum]KAI9199412.1 FACT complex subunit-domain-containing protein [Polychytrium aggregatum]
MASVKIDARNFHKRAKLLLATWKGAGRVGSAEEFAEADALLVAVGANNDDEASFSKSTAVQMWLLGYEFSDTIIVFTPEKIYVLCGAKKANYLEPLKQYERGVPLEIFIRGKEAGSNLEGFQKLFEVMAGSKAGKRIGVLTKDQYSSKFYTEWKEALGNAPTKFEQVDISVGIGSVLAIKDEDELRSLKLASKVTSCLLNEYFVTEMESILDQERKVTHIDIATATENMLQDPKAKSRLKLPSEADIENLDICYTPIIQSGGKFNLKPSAVSDSEFLHEGTIIASLGFRYKQYCANISRTYLVNPTKGQEKNYKFLVELQQYALSVVKDGAQCRDVYAKLLSYIEKKRPDLKSFFVKSCGFGMGLEFRESNYMLSPKNPRELKADMVLNLILGFEGLENPDAADARDKSYSLLLSDTIRVTRDIPIVLTESSKELSKIRYVLADEGETEVKKEKNDGMVRKSAVLESKLRGEEKDEIAPEQRRKIHQKQLAEQKRKEGIARFAERAKNADGTEAPIFKKFESYRKEAQLPKEVQSCKIVVDSRSESIILPINGFAVPFHITTLKNVSKNDETDFTYLRLNFVTPGQSFGKKDTTSPFENPNATFIRSLSFRSSDHYRFNEIFKQINDLKKESQKREAERKEKADLIEQDRLVEVKGRRPLRLPEVYARPVVESKRVPGDLEIHINGIRYQSQLKSDQRIDILFSNIKHLFFQPCDNELVVIIHVHLKNPIMIGKKKTKDIQFFREVGDASFDETGNRRRRMNYGDEDELAQEQEERRRRQLLNREFQMFAEKITELSKSIEVDIPFRELGFYGVPHRELVLLQPTTDCVVHLTNPPFTVVTIEEVEIAHLERVQFGLKNFDLVFVFKDFTRAPVHINTIPTNSLESVKDWLDSVDVQVTEGPVNLNWNEIMKTVTKDPITFFQDGGWSFLGGDSDNDSGSEDDEESEFDIGEYEDDDESSESDSYDDEGSGSSDYSGSEESESGESWDELERKAEKADKKRTHGSKGDSGDERSSKKSKR